jgi:hypothetical protein
MQHRSRGPRPRFFKDPQLDTFHVTLVALMEEVAVLHERLDTAERLLAAKGVLKTEEIEEYVPDPVAYEERIVWQDAFVQRVLRVVFEEAAQLKSGVARFATVEDVIDFVSNETPEVSHAGA